MTRVLVRPAAAADIEDAYRWYQQQRQGLGGDFLAALRETMDAIRDRPNAFPVVYRGARRALVRSRFPYGLFYQVHGESILVLACMHAKRDPRRWRTRAARRRES